MNYENLNKANLDLVVSPHKRTRGAGTHSEITAGVK